MWAIGELIILIIYVILGIPPLLVITRLKKAGQVSGGKIICLVLALVPISLFGYSQYINHRNAELEYVGVYHLTDYPSYDSCSLSLKANHSYTVNFAEKVLEQGKWKYSSGGDYWIVYIGESGQLGFGKYKYYQKDNGFKD